MTLREWNILQAHVFEHNGINEIEEVLEIGKIISVYKKMAWSENLERIIDNRVERLLNN